MKTLKIISLILISGSLLNLFFSLNDSHYANRLFSICINTIVIISLLWSLKNSKKINIAKLLFIITFLQLFSIKIGWLNYIYVSGLGIITYVDINSKKTISTLTTLSSTKLLDFNVFHHYSIGLNIIPLIIITTLLFTKHKTAYVQ